MFPISIVSPRFSSPDRCGRQSRRRRSRPRRQPAPTATATGSSPTGMRWRSSCSRQLASRGRLRCSRPSPHRSRTRSPSTAADVGAAERTGAERRRIEAVDRRVAGAHDPDHAAASMTAVGRLRASITSPLAGARRRVDLGHRPVAEDGPDAARPGRDGAVGRAAPRLGDVERLLAAELRIDPRHLARQAVRGPEVTVAERDPGRRRRQGDGLDDVPRTPDRSGSRSCR